MKIVSAPLYTKIETAQLAVRAVIVRGAATKGTAGAVKDETLVQLTLALQSLETAYDRVRRADESESS